MKPVKTKVMKAKPRRSERDGNGRSDFIKAAGSSWRRLSKWYRNGNMVI